MKNHRGFTIIELLVVVSIIALLVGILLPAIGKARDQAQLTKSQANLKQIGTAHVSYAAEYADRQVTWINDNFSQYGSVAGYLAQVGYEHPWMIVGYGQGAIWHIIGTGSIEPYVWGGVNFGTFRIPNASALSRYLNGRFYDPIFYAPKDTAVIASAGVIRSIATLSDTARASARSTAVSVGCGSRAGLASPQSTGIARADSGSACGSGIG